MKKLTITQARDALGDTVNRVSYGHERILIERRGRNMAALVPVEDLELLEQLERQLDLDAAREALREPGSIAWEDVKAELGL